MRSKLELSAKSGPTPNSELGATCFSASLTLMALLTTCSRPVKLGISSHGFSRQPTYFMPKPSRLVSSARTSSSSSKRAVTFLRPHTLRYGQKPRFYIAPTVRSYTQESTKPAVEEVPSLPSKERIPRIPLLISAISVVPFLACSVIPFAFPFEYVPALLQSRKPLRAVP